MDLDGGDTATVNFNLAVVSILPRAFAARGFTAAWTAEGLSLKLPSMPGARTLSIFDLAGDLRHRAVAPAGVDRMLLPGKALQGRGLLLVLEGQGWRETLPLPGR